MAAAGISVGPLVLGRKEEVRMENHSVSFREFGLGLIIGLAAGSLLGIIFAPQSGTATRTQIRTRASDFKGSVEDFVEAAKKNIESASARIEGVFGREEQGLRRRLEKIRAELESYDLKQA
ncbi:MAG: YtxH domain-containing protein [Terriglobia bacterium]